MHVVVLGGGGFIGKRLAEELLASGGLKQGKISSMTIVDKTFPPDMPADSRVECSAVDFCDATEMRQVLLRKPAVIFHLAAIVSGEAEKNFDLGMKVNFHATLQLLELCRELSLKPRIVFASSCGVFGGDVSNIITDETDPKPRSSYGTQKVMAELLINDFSRRGFVDGRSIRLPTITVRPGKPNAATSSFISGIIREPLSGQPASYPVPPATAFWVLSPKRVVENFIHAANIEASELGNDRTITLPGLTVSVQEMLDSLEKIAGTEVVQQVSHVPDAFLESIVLTWPAKIDPQRGLQLGFVRDRNMDEIIQQYVDEQGIELSQK
nr:NAD-dependent epimerase/dehydratase family protein [Cytophagales bacterium]